MIFFLGLEREAWTLTKYLDERGQAWNNEIKVIPYEALSRTAALPVGTYIFSDLDRLSKAQTALATDLYQRLKESDPRLLLLNDPANFVGRFDLLKKLSDRGQNDFRAFRPYDLPDGLRYPVFLRMERDHMGSRTPLLNSRSELDQAISDAICNGAWPGNLMVIEFCDISDAQGVYRKYSVSRFGKHYMARHQLTGFNWIQKNLTSKDGLVWPSEWVAEERRFIDSNPHLKQVKEVFEMANIEYGRIDYGMKDGRMQVWEINTNPACMTSRQIQIPERLPLDDIIASRFDEAWRTINCPLPPTPPIKYRFDYRQLLTTPIEEWAMG